MASKYIEEFLGEDLCMKCNDYDKKMFDYLRTVKNQLLDINDEDVYVFKHTYVGQGTVCRVYRYGDSMFAIDIENCITMQDNPISLIAFGTKDPVYNHIARRYKEIILMRFEEDI